MGVKLGTFLVREGAITAQQLEEALRIQVLYGGRLGTNLVELNCISVDALAEWLSRVTHYPPANEWLMEAAQPDAIELIPADVAEKYECFPLRREGRRLHVAMVNPADLAATDAIAFKTGMRLVLYVVPEILLYSYLEKRYGIVRKLRYVRLASQQNGPVVPPGVPREAPRPAEVMPPLPPPMPEPVAAGASTARLPPTPPPAIPPPRLTPVPSLAVPVSVPPPVVPVAKSAFPPVAVAVPPIAASPSGWTPRVSASQVKAAQAGEAPLAWSGERAPHVTEASFPPGGRPVLSGAETAIPASSRPGGALSFDEARAALAAASSRDGIADALLRFAPDKLDTMLLFVLRDGMALGWKGRGPGIDETVADRVMLPLNAPSMFQEATDRKQPVGGAVSDLTLHKHFFKALRRGAPASALVVPVLVGERAVNLIYVDSMTRGDATEYAAPLVRLAEQVTSAYGRLVRESKRLPTLKR